MATNPNLSDKLVVRNLDAGNYCLPSCTVKARKGQDVRQFATVAAARYVGLGDSGLATQLQRVMKLKERPNAEETARPMSKYAPNRALENAHLWAALTESLAKRLEQ